MRIALIFLITYLITHFLVAQRIDIPMTAKKWKYDGSKVEFVKHNSVNAIKSIDGAYYEVFLKDQEFTNGTIEFDVELIGQGFPGIYFRLSEDWKDGEFFYIRSFGKVTPDVRTTIQYATIIDDINMWDMTDEYQSGAEIYQEGWNHVKLVINGRQLKAYVNDMKVPALHVPALESDQTTGGIMLSGNVIYANLEITPDATEDVMAAEGYTSTINDTRYLRNWEVTETSSLPPGQDIKIQVPGLYQLIEKSDLPDSTTAWKPLKADRRAMVNLTRLFGADENDGRRLAWLKTSISSESDQERLLNLGFSDEVWVLLNGELLYLDKNLYGTLQQKAPNGRCTIENATIKLPLKKGENEILIGLANYFFGWGLIARLDDTVGLTLK